MKRLITAVSMFVLAFGCSTAYQSHGATGGYSDTKLSPRSYQIRFQGNGFTQNDRVSVFMLRHAAELTLENGFRYFLLTGQQTQTSVSHAGGISANFPNQSSIVRFLDRLEDDPAAADAVTVIHETDTEAQGALSEKARAALSKY
jgi:hypothetical protein